MFNKFLLAFFLLSMVHKGFAQQQKPVAWTQFALGAGIGLDYGGLGVKFEYAPIPHLAVFAAAGYNIVDMGLNGGVSYKISPAKKVVPTLLAMYGYNAAMLVTSSDNRFVYRNTYYGLTLGGGLDIKIGKRANTLSANLLIPIRNAKFRREYDAFKDAGADFDVPLLPITLSVGFNFSLKKKTI